MDCGASTGLDVCLVHIILLERKVCVEIVPGAQFSGRKFSFMIFTGRNVVQAFCDSERSNIRAITLGIYSDELKYFFLEPQPPIHSIHISSLFS